jgi:hypothetical protein
MDRGVHAAGDSRNSSTIGTRSYGMDAAFNAVRSAAGSLPDALDLGFHCVRTHWIRDFMTFQLARRARSVMLMVLVLRECGFGECATRARPIADQKSRFRVHATRHREHTADRDAFRL